MVLTEAVKKVLDQNYKSNTIVTMIGAIKRVMKDVGIENVTFDKKYIIKNFNKIKDILTSINQSPVTFYILRVGELEKIPNKKLQELKDLKDKQQINRNIEYKSKEEEIENDALYDWDGLMELQGKFERDYEDNKTDVNYNLKYLFLSLIKYLEPQRSQIYTDTILVTNNPRKQTSNFLNLNTGLLRLVEYKTKSNYGTKDIILSEPLMKIVNKVHNQIGNKYLISRIGDVNEMQSSQSFGQYLRNFIGVSTSGIRSLYVSYLHSKGLKPNTNQMLHSKSVSDAVYNRHFENHIVNDGKIFIPVNKGDLIEKDGKMYIKAK